MDHARIFELAAEKIGSASIAKLVGCCRMQVYRILKERATNHTPNSFNPSLISIIVSPITFVEEAILSLQFLRVGAMLRRWPTTSQYTNKMLKNT
ncbi:helix-turn-helix domain-containing protein [Mesorhizobium sp. M0146]|uniref:helix-turn-helix domain-containing protein n=1 Tax=unclassified Mesorhizobium TaxID=325217 RepID=UPI00333801DC